MKEVTESNKFLGTEIRQDYGKLVLSVNSTILRKSEMHDCKPVKPHAVIGEDLNDYKDSPPVIVSRSSRIFNVLS